MAGVGFRMHVGVWERLGVGFAWQAWGFVRFDIAERVFRMVGVGNGGYRRRRARGFAW